MAVFFPTMERPEMRVEAHLPDGIRSFKYVVNHHYIKLTDWYGNEIKLDAASLVKYTCEDCENVFFTSSNYGESHCPACKGRAVPQWGAVQLCFVPESESEFAVKPADVKDKK